MLAPDSHYIFTPYAAGVCSLVDETSPPFEGPADFAKPAIVFKGFTSVPEMPRKSRAGSDLSRSRPTNKWGEGMKFNDRRKLIAMLGLWSVLGAGCTSQVVITMNDVNRSSDSLTAKKPAVTMLRVEDTTQAPEYQKNPRYLGDGTKGFFLIGPIPIAWEWNRYHADNPRTDLVRDAFTAKLNKAGLLVTYQPDRKLDELSPLPDGHLVVSSKIRSIEVSNSISFITLIVDTVGGYGELEANVVLDCQVYQPGNPTPLWQGTVEGKAEESEITDEMKIEWEQRKPWVIRKALDSALQEFVTKSGIHSISVRLRGEAYAKAVKASQEAEAAGKLPQALQLYAKAYSLADTEDRSLPMMKAIARLTRSQSDKAALPEEARRYGVQATSFVEKKRYDEAIALYDQALELAPWWAEGHFNRALVTATQNRYREAVTSMKLFLVLVPTAPDARAAQDKIYEWELEKK